MDAGESLPHVQQTDTDKATGGTVANKSDLTSLL
jgi:hypothetical protein